MMTEIPIIAVKSQYDQVLAFFNNAAPKAMHFKNDRLHEYVKGNASQFTFKTAAKHSDSQYLVEGNRLAFRWENKDYDLNIVKVVRDEKVVEVTAYSTMFELLYETRGEYTGNSMTFEQYLNVFDPEHVLVVGVNEVSSAKISNKWEGTQTILARLFSLATVFSAELEFVTELNDDYTLKQVTMNVYKEYSDGLNQGIGQNRSEVILKYGKGITGITKTSDISDGIYTAILAYGKDGLSINDIERNWYNEDGNLEYFTRKGQPRVYAPLARDNFPSNLFASENERYIGYEADDTEYTSQEALLGYMLSELKKLSTPEVTYEIDGKFDVDVGDTIIVEDDGYNPTLYLSVRVAETEKSLSNPSIRKAVISNVKELISEIDASLLAKVQALIEANKTYNFEILTSSGIVFKNGFGSTTLTARVRDGIKDVTDTFSLKWYKDGTLFSNTKTVTINAADIEEKAVFRFEVADDSGNVRGGSEVTVTNIDDGKEGKPGKSPIITVNDDSSLTIEDDEGTKQTEPLKGESGKGVSAEEISYAISQDGTTPPTSGWSGTRPTPKAGWYMWTRTRFKYTDNTYSAYFYLVAQQGKDAIIISDTAPANPTKGTLWQDSSVVPQIIKVFDGAVWSMWGMPIDNLLATNILSENGVFKRLEGAEIVNTFSYTDSGVTYTGTTTIKDGNVTIARTGSDGSTWTTTMDRVQGFVDTYKASSSSPARIAQLGQGKLYLAESGVGGYLPAAAVNPASWTNLSYAPGFTTAENNPCQYRKVQIVDGSWELQLRGQIKPTSGDFSTTASPTGGILPAGYRPTRNELVPAADSTKKGARVVVLADGQIQLNTPNGGNYVSFGGIRIAL
jgi:hypothetical protein